MCTTQYTWKPWRGWEMAEQLIGSGTFWGGRRFCCCCCSSSCSSSSFSFSSSSFCKSNTSGSGKAVFYATFLAWRQKHKWVFCCWFFLGGGCFFNMNFFLELQPSTSLPRGDGVEEWGKRGKRRVGSKWYCWVFFSCLSNKVFSELNQKTCTVELWVKLFL